MQGLGEVAGLVGTVAFAAPEQVEGRPSVAADLFGLGATAWAWLTGHGPYEQATADATRRAALAGEPHPLPADVPPAVAALLPLFIRSERLRPVQWLGMVCAFAAVVFALREGFGSGDATGDLMGLAAGALWGLTTVAIRATHLTRISAEKLLFYQLAVSTVVLGLLSQRWAALERKR